MLSSGNEQLCTKSFLSTNIKCGGVLLLGYAQSAVASTISHALLSARYERLRQCHKIDILLHIAIVPHREHYVIVEFNN